MSAHAQAQTYLLDTSFLIDLADEIDAGKEGPAHRALEILPERGVFISPATLAEILEGAADWQGTLEMLSQYQWQTIGWAAAQRCARNQSRDAARRMGENDAWQAAIAVASGHRLVGHDDAFKDRPWLDYVDHRRF